jgi:hypothetical protein
MRISTGLTVAVLCLVSIFATNLLGWRLAAPITAAPLASPRQAGGPGSQRCSARTLQGSYGIRFEGTKIGVGPFVSVSRITFDGQGQFTTNEVGRSNGALVQRTFTGPYVVNDDCTGYLNFSSNLTNPPHEAFGNFVIVDEGKEFFVLDNEDGWAASGVGKRI